MILHLEPVLSGKIGTMRKEVLLESDKLSNNRFYEAKDDISYTLANDQKSIEFFLSYKKEKSVVVEANVNLICKTLCSRCLKPTEFPLFFKIAREIDFNLTEEQRREAMDEMDFIHGFDLDTERLLQEEIMLNLPMQILCKEDCKGLCPICGIDRNKKVCHCDNMPKDPRMAMIAELFRQSIKEDMPESDSKEV